MGPADQEGRSALLSLVLATLVALALLAVAVWPRRALLPAHATRAFETDAPPAQPAR